LKRKAFYDRVWKSTRRSLFLNSMYFENLVVAGLELAPPVIRWMWFKAFCGKLGARVLIDYGTYLRYPRKIYIGDDVSINRGCKIFPSLMLRDARVYLRNGATLGPGVTLFGAGQDPRSEDLADVAADIVVGEGAYIGGNSTIRFGVSIGEGSVVAAGSVVVKDVAPWTIVAGVPATKIADRNLRKD